MDRSSSTERRSSICAPRRCGRCAARCRSSFRIRTARSARGCRSRRSSRRGWWFTARAPRRANASALICRALEEVELDPATAPSLSARAFRRPAATRGHRARDGARTEAGRARRTHVRARRLDSGADRRCCSRAASSAIASAYLFISHDLRVVRAMSHEVVVMRDGTHRRARHRRSRSSRRRARPTPRR